MRSTEYDPTPRADAVIDTEPDALPEMRDRNPRAHLPGKPPSDPSESAAAEGAAPGRCTLLDIVTGSVQVSPPGPRTTRFAVPGDAVPTPRGGPHAAPGETPLLTPDPSSREEVTHVVPGTRVDPAPARPDGPDDAVPAPHPSRLDVRGDAPPTTRGRQRAAHGQRTGSPDPADSSDMLRAVLDAVDVGVLVREPDGATVATNARARRLLGDGSADPGVSLSSSTVPGPDGRPELVVTTMLENAAGPGREQALAVVERRFRAAMEHSPVGFAVLEPDGTILEANRSLARILAEEPDRLPGLRLWEFAHPDDPGTDTELHAGVLDGHRDSYTIERRYLRPGGETVWARTTVTAVRDRNDSLLHLITQLQDVTDIRLAQEELRHQSLHDPLTGLPNRTLGLDRIQQALDRTARSRRRVAVLSCELDRFKVVNDSIGHVHGDAVLVEVARRLQRVLRSTDTAARVGGDEFLVVCEDVLDEREAVLVADRILATVREPIEVDGHGVVQTVSIGIAVSSARSADALALLRDAGTALHRAKEKGLGSWDVVDDELRRHAVERLDIEHALRAALRHEDLRLHFQPIVEVSSGRPVGQEALVRWQHPDRGLLSPAWFLPVAEDTGLIEDLGRWVLLAAARTAAAAPHSGYIAVNVSPSQVMRAGLLADVESVLERTRLPANRLVVELTESVMLGAAPAGRKELHQLDELGVRLVVDDFGTGFSALSYLRDLPVSGIKVDRSFTSGLGTDAQCDRIVEALTGLAHGLGVDLVAEGVETELQRNQLTRIGCVYAQGYLFGRPAPCTG